MCVCVVQKVGVGSRQIPGGQLYHLEDTVKLERWRELCYCSAWRESLWHSGCTIYRFLSGNLVRNRISHLISLEIQVRAQVSTKVCVCP